MVIFMSQSQNAFSWANITLCGAGYLYIQSRCYARFGVPKGNLSETTYLSNLNNLSLRLLVCRLDVDHAIYRVNGCCEIDNVSLIV